MDMEWLKRVLEEYIREGEDGDDLWDEKSEERVRDFVGYVEIVIELEEEEKEKENG